MNTFLIVRAISQMFCYLDRGTEVIQLLLRNINLLCKGINNTYLA